MSLSDTLIVLCYLLFTVSYILIAYCFAYYFNTILTRKSFWSHSERLCIKVCGIIK